MSEKPRIKPLDTFRGIAALVVVVFHASAGIAGNTFVNTSPLYLAISSNEAVLFFFVLSGYVLVYQYGISTKFAYKTFIIQRFFRLYIPYFFALIIACLLFKYSTVNISNDIWLSKIWHVPLTKELIINHVILLTDFNTLALNPAIWSLVHEMRIAVIFPVLLFTILKFPSRKVVLSAVLLSFSAAIVRLFVNEPVGYHSGYIDTLYYLYMFLLGGIIAKNQNELVFRYQQLSGGNKTFILGLALTLYCYAHTLQWISTGYAIGDRLVINIADLIVVVSSGYFIIYGIYLSGKKNFFNNAIGYYLGRISYSLYLIHIPVCEFVYLKFFATDGKLPKAVVLLFIIISLITGAIFNYLIERPAQKIAKK